MSTHPSKLTGQLEGMSVEELAIQLSQLRYDTLSKFLDCLASNISADGDKDHDAGRVILSSFLDSTARKLWKAGEEISSAWGVCEPYMEGDETKK